MTDELGSADTPLVSASGVTKRYGATLALNNAGIVIERGDIFFSAQDPPRNHFRLGFSAIPRHRIEPGLRLLAQIADTIT